MIADIETERPDFLAIDFKRHTFYMDERRIAFQGDPVFSVLEALIDRGHKRLMPSDIKAIAASAGAVDDDIAYAEIKHLRRRLEDTDGGLVSGNAQNGYYFSGSPVIYVASPDPAYGWQDIYDIYQIKEPLGEVKVEPVPGGIIINNRMVPLMGLEQEIVLSTPNTGEQIIAPRILAYEIYGDKDMTRKLEALIYALNHKRLRPNGVEIASVRRGRKYPAVGYYLRVYWQRMQYDMRAYLNFARGAILSNGRPPFWPDLIEETYSMERLVNFSLEKKLLYQIQTPENIFQAVLQMHELAELSGMNNCPEEMKIALQRMRVIRGRRKTERGFRGDVWRMLEKSYRYYQESKGDLDNQMLPETF